MELLLILGSGPIKFKLCNDCCYIFDSARGGLNDGFLKWFQSVKNTLIIVTKNPC